MPAGNFVKKIISSYEDDYTRNSSVVRYFLKINVKMRKKDDYFGHVPDNNPFSAVWKKTIRGRFLLLSVDHLSHLEQFKV